MEADNINQLAQGAITASAPCRIDMGGTLDLPALHYALQHLRPCTFNVALDLRTRVTVSTFDAGWVKIVSKGFEPAVFKSEDLPLQHPLGLMFAIAAFFNLSGVQIEIVSASPPRSALGGSSVAAVALIAALAELGQRSGKKPLTPNQMVRLAHMIESNVAGVPCGFQDHLAAAFGGANLWYWHSLVDDRVFSAQPICAVESLPDLNQRFLIAYGGIPHASKDINSRWVSHFLSGRERQVWYDIIRLTQGFADALRTDDLEKAVDLVDQEVQLRRHMTPDVIDDLGQELVVTARNRHCGARFTGAGGGGCFWALGRPADIIGLRGLWQDILSRRDSAHLLAVDFDPQGVRIEA